jgi:hypothetical protein
VYFCVLAQKTTEKLLQVANHYVERCENGFSYKIIITIIIIIIVNIIIPLQPFSRPWPCFSFLAINIVSRTP